MPERHRRRDQRAVPHHDAAEQVVRHAGTSLLRARTTTTCTLAAALVLIAGAAPAAAGPAGGSDRAGGAGTTSVVVQGGSGGVDQVVDAVEAVGGTVQERLEVVDGVSAQVPSASLARLSALDGVRSVAVDSRLVPLDQVWGDDTTGEGRKASLLTGSWRADKDQGSAYTIAKQIGAHTVWGKSDPRNSSRKLTGHGVGVALIDTGVAPVEGLLGAGKLVNGPDLSFESQSANTRYLDGYGHGTHMAGLIAGRDSAVPAGNENDAKHFVGMAPDATLVNVRVGAGDGGVDVSQVIAGIDWVVTNRSKHNIRVLNLSYGTDSTQAPALDPLAHAVQNAWRAGIVVVVAAGNDGAAGPRPLTMPAIDPYVIAVGSVDHQGVDRPEARRVGAWTNSGTSSRRPDLIAPGKSVVSLRVPGSAVDRDHPEGRVTGDRSGRLFRGTGTSQSAAVVSGAAALLVQRNPSLTPDQVKGLLKANADKLVLDPSVVQGSGMLDIKGAVERLESSTPVPTYAQTSTRSTGTGSLDAARGGSYVVDPDTGHVLRGERDIFGATWTPSVWAKASSAGTAWSGGTWNGTVWAGPTWATSTTWAPTQWTRRSWSGVDWSRRSWSTMTFLRRSWSGDDWLRRSWSADSWTRRSWSTDLPR